MNSCLKLIVLTLCLSVALTAEADNGISGLGEALVWIGIVVSVIYLIVVYIVSFLLRLILNEITRQRQQSLWKIFLGVLLFSLAIILYHGIGDLSFSSGYTALIIICGLIGGITGYFVPRKNEYLPY